jgi:hypothetical protein
VLGNLFSSPFGDWRAELSHKKQREWDLLHTISETLTQSTNNWGGSITKAFSAFVHD